MNEMMIEVTQKASSFIMMRWPLILLGGISILLLVVAYNKIMEIYYLAKCDWREMLPGLLLAIGIGILFFAS